MQGLVAYGYAAADGNQTVSGNADVIFNLGGTPFPNAGITVPAPGSSSFVVLSDGDYEYDFYVVGQNDEGNTNALVFGIFLNGASQGSAHEFRSNQQASINDFKVCRGQGIISIGVGTTVTLRNRTGDGTNNVVLNALPPGNTTPSANATLSLKKLSP